MKKNKLLAVLLALAMTLSLLPTAALAEDKGTECGESCTVEGHVAAIGTKHYTSLADAIEAVPVDASEASTVTILKNVENVSTVRIEQDQKIILDLNGKNITAAVRSDNASKHYYAIDNYGNFTLKDTSAEPTGTITARGIENLGAGVMTIESGKIVACDTNGGACIWNEGALTINGGTFETTHVGSSSDTYGVGCLNNRGTALITSGNFKGVNKRTYAIISTGKIEITPANDKEVNVAGAHGGLAIDSGTAVVNGGSYSSTEYYGLYVSNDGVGTDPRTAAVTVNGGSFTGPNYSVWIGSDYNNPVNSTIEINGGTFNRPLNAQDCTRGDAISIKGGTFSSNPTAYVNPATHTVTGPTDGKHTVAPRGAENSEAKIGETYYKTLADAIAAADPNDTVTLVTDVTDEPGIKIEKNITLDLNGKTLKRDNGQALWVAGGNVSVIGTGTISSDDTRDGRYAALVGWGSNEATLTIGENVTVSGSAEYGVCALGSENVPANLIVNGKVTTTGKGAAISGNGNRSPSNITINDGAVVSCTNGAGIYFPQNGTLTINGGTITGVHGVQMCSGILNISGNPVITATGADASSAKTDDGPIPDGAAVSVVNRNYPGGAPSATISGTPNLKAQSTEQALRVYTWADNKVSEWVEGKNAVSVTGGTFSSNPSAYVASGYAVGGSGPYTVYLPSSTPSTPTPPSQPTTSTETKPDGSTTTTETKPDGTVTESNTSKPVTDASGNTSQTTTETSTGKDGVTESKTETVTKPDGSASSTTESTTTKPDGTKTESTTETTVNKDGSTASTTTATTTNKDGTVTESKTEATTSTVTNKDGSTTETKQETTTTSTGSKTESTTVTTVNKDGSTTATTTATTTDKAGTVTESKTESTTNKNGTTKETTSTTETKANGTVTESKTETTINADGSSKATTTETVTKADGTKVESKTTATTSLSTNKATGTVTETKKESTTTSDGVKSEGTTVTQIQKDGTVTSKETVKASDSTGTTATKTTTLDAKGEVTTTAEVSVSSKAVTEAAKTGAAVTIPVEVTATKSASTAPTVSVSVPKTAESVKVELPVQNVTPGTVAVIVNADGTEKIVSTSMVTENGVALKLDGSATVKLVDNAKSFTDVPETNVFYNEISSLSARNIMIGVSNEKFDLHNSVTLNQVANVAGRITGEVDVNDFNAGVVWGNENGLKTGSTAATRGEVLKALYVAAGSPAVEDTSILSRFKDASSIPADLAAIAAWAAQNGILKGNMDGTAALSANVTRGQACALAGRTMGTLA